MAGNSSPIFSRVGDIQGGVLIVNSSTNSAIADFAGTGTFVVPVFTADLTNGGFIQRIRFKARADGANVATVARIWINEGTLNLLSPLAAPGTPSGTPSTSGGSLNTGTFYAKVQAVDQWGGLSAASAESSAVNVLAPTNAGSISWSWTAATGAASYRLYVGPVSGGEYSYFVTTATSYTQQVAVIAGQLANPADYVVNNMFYGELSLPATAISQTAATTELDYPMNLALPPGYRVLVGLGNNVATGWYVMGIGGKY
jgi:hypothetical protein